MENILSKFIAFPAKKKKKIELCQNVVEIEEENNDNS